MANTYTDRFTKLIDDMYERCNIPRIFPVPTVKIANNLGYKVYTFEPKDDDISGYVNYAKKKICLNASDIHKRQNFTLAHEIAHILLGHDKDGEEIDRRTSIWEPQKQKEIDANDLAGELLLPKEKVLEIWNIRKSFDDVSDYFDASMQACVVRLERLGEL